MGEGNLENQDKLILRGLQFYGFHGVHPVEKEQGQKFLVDIDAWLDLRIAGETDDITDTVSYTDIYRTTKEIMEGPSQNLLESVAHLIANTTLLKYPQIHAVRVKVGKPDILVDGPMDYLGIEILRSRVNNENK
ncbi:dihydroneopterin aldolase 2-like [Dendrobium catenatum]|uniref:dihydroneopterin aldolase 2-like n=1 Tax=Dendrobium catenatum TaxID=906689 RepID=UPI0009F161DB|nr:dihydroneopterin aldolase 2-like [Dendrobium catenatum]XP_020686907.1 dihydroneopterin aldolase 2-like [Dendrobium catenatum]